MTTHLPINEFHMDGLAPNAKHRLFLELTPPGNGEQLGLPIMAAVGREPGPTVIVFGGVHGDELEGIQAIHEVWPRLRPETMRGRVVAVPVANIPAYRAVRRTSPIDGLNLARTFPGRADGTVTERLAHYLSTLLIPRADFFIDLHTAGLTYLMPTMVGYDASGTEAGERSKEAARHFGMSLMWGHPQIAPGRSLCEAIRLRIPWLYVEAASGGRVSQPVLDAYTNGLERLLMYLKVIPGDVTSQSPEVHLIGSGDLDRTIPVNTSGFFAAQVSLLQDVAKGQLIGLVRDFWGETLEEVRAPGAGCVGMLRAIPPVMPGDSVCLLAERV